MAAAEQQHRRSWRRTRKRRRSEDKQEEKRRIDVAEEVIGGGPAERAGGHANPRIGMDNRDKMDSTDEGHVYSTTPSCSSFDYSCLDLDRTIL